MRTTKKTRAERLAGMARMLTLLFKDDRQVGELIAAWATMTASQLRKADQHFRRELNGQGVGVAAA